jgi:hypothetical protein
MTTEELLSQIKEILTRKSISMTAFADSLNKFLPKKHRRDITRSRMVIIYRWFAGGDSHRNPNSHTILAMKDWYNANRV